MIKNRKSAPKKGAGAPKKGALVAGGQISTALFGKTRRAILALLFGHPDESFYLRQVVKTTGLGNGVIFKELKSLSAAGILVSHKSGQEVHYTANKDCPIFDELVGLVVKTFGVADVLREALVPLAKHIETAFIYGSFAKGTQRQGSDVDLMVVGEVSFEDVVGAILPVQKKIRREVNPTVYAEKEFREKLSEKNHFLTRVLEREKIFLIGSDFELGKLG